MEALLASNGSSILLSSRNTSHQTLFRSPSTLAPSEESESCYTDISETGSSLKRISQAKAVLAASQMYSPEFTAGGGASGARACYARNTGALGCLLARIEVEPDLDSLRACLDTLAFLLLDKANRKAVLDCPCLETVMSVVQRTTDTALLFSALDAVCSLAKSYDARKVWLWQHPAKHKLLALVSHAALSASQRIKVLTLLRKLAFAAALPPTCQSAPHTPAAHEAHPSQSGQRSPCSYPLAHAGDSQDFSAYVSTASSTAAVPLCPDSPDQPRFPPHSGGGSRTRRRGLANSALPGTAATTAAAASVLQADHMKQAHAPLQQPVGATGCAQREASVPASNTGLHTGGSTRSHGSMTLAVSPPLPLPPAAPQLLEPGLISAVAGLVSPSTHHTVLSRVLAMLKLCADCASTQQLPVWHTVVFKLVPLLRDPGACEATEDVLLSLSENTAFRNVFVAAGTISPLLTLLLHPNKILATNAVCVLSLLCEGGLPRDQLSKDGSLLTLLRTLQSTPHAEVAIGGVFILDRLAAGQPAVISALASLGAVQLLAHAQQSRHQQWDDADLRLGVQQLLSTLSSANGAVTHSADTAPSQVSGDSGSSAAHVAAAARSSGLGLGATLTWGPWVSPLPMAAGTPAHPASQPRNLPPVRCISSGLATAHDALSSSGTEGLAGQGLGGPAARGATSGRMTLGSSCREGGLQVLRLVRQATTDAWRGESLLSTPFAGTHAIELGDSAPPSPVIHSPTPGAACDPTPSSVKAGASMAGQAAPLSLSAGVQSQSKDRLHGVQGLLTGGGVSQHGGRYSCDAEPVHPSAAHSAMMCQPTVRHSCDHRPSPAHPATHALHGLTHPIQRGYDGASEGGSDGGPGVSSHLLHPREFTASRSHFAPDLQQQGPDQGPDARHHQWLLRHVEAAMPCSPQPPASPPVGLPRGAGSTLAHTPACPGLAACAEDSAFESGPSSFTQPSNLLDPCLGLLLHTPRERKRQLLPWFLGPSSGATFQGDEASPPGGLSAPACLLASLSLRGSSHTCSELQAGDAHTGTGMGCDAGESPANCCSGPCMAEGSAADCASGGCSPDQEPACRDHAAAQGASDGSAPARSCTDGSASLAEVDSGACSDGTASQGSSSDGGSVALRRNANQPAPPPAHSLHHRSNRQDAVETAMPWPYALASQPELEPDHSDSLDPHTPRTAASWLVHVEDTAAARQGHSLPYQSPAHMQASPLADSTCGAVCGGGGNSDTVLLLTADKAAVRAAACWQLPHAADAEGCDKSDASVWVAPSTQACS